MKKDTNSKIYELKEKIKENKIIENEENKFDDRKEIILNTDLQNAKSVYKANQKPKGKIKINNTIGSIIDLINVNMVYSNKKRTDPILVNINHSFKKGELYTISGVSGCGKTTLLGLIRGTLRATTGDVVVDNINISALKDKEIMSFRRNVMGVVAQDMNLLSDLSIKENIEIDTFLQKNGSKRKDVDKLLKDNDLSNEEFTKPINLSKGDQQIIAIIRMIAKSPKIIVLDEPASDVETSKFHKLVSTLLNLARRDKICVIIATNREEIVKLSDVKLRIENGSLIVKQ